MATKGSVRERAYRGAKPDSAGCNGQLDLEARFKDPPGQFKHVDLCRQVYFGEEHLHFQAGLWCALGSAMEQVAGVTAGPTAPRSREARPPETLVKSASRRTPPHPATPHYLFA
jgi:hypothetical protein